MRIKPSYIKTLIPFVLLILTILIQQLFKANPALTEQIYSNGIYPVLAYILSNISGLVPFSLDDVFYVGLVLALLLGLILVFIKRLRITKYLLRILQVVALVYVLFYWFWGFNYYREPAHHRFNLVKSSASDSSFIETYKLIIEKTNACYTPSPNLINSKYDDVIETSYKDLSEYFNLNHTMGRRRIKHITFSNFFAKAGVLGYYGPFFNEVHINKHLTIWDIPMVSAHEKSHQMGITSEAEANFYGWLSCISSNEPFVEYSGWLYALNYFNYQSRSLKQRGELVKKIRPEVIADIRARHTHWKKWRNEKIDKAASKVNDAYLKSNNVEKGIEDYNGMVQLIVDYLQQDFLK